MKIIIFIIVLVLILLGTILYFKNRPAKIIPIGQMLDEEINKYSHNYQPSIAIGVYKNGKVFFKNVGQSISEESVFQIGSITKLFTANSLQVLADEQKLSFNTSIDELLKDLQKNLEIDPQVKSISLLDLATHTSGIPSVPKPLMTYVENQTGKENLLINPYSYLSNELILEYLKSPVDIRDKKQFEYSNYGMGLLGYLLAEKNQTSYEELIEQTILKPLDMSNSFIHKQSVEKLVKGFTAEGKPTPPWTFGALEAAGAFNSSSNDMMKFIIANLEHHSPLFNTFIKTHDAQKNGETGIGWMQPNAIDKLAGNSSMVWHNGMVGGFASYIAIDKKQQTGLIFLSNHAIDATVVGTMIMRRLKNSEFPE